MIKMFENNIYIKDTKKYGKSIFAKRGFKKNETVFVVFGPITKKPSMYTVPIGFELYIDPLPPVKYLCHSCNPSCGIKNRNEVVAMRNIKKDEEITIDYAMIVPNYAPELLKLANMSKKDLKCKCGSKNCRGEFGSYETLPKKLKTKYKGYVSDYLTN